MAEGRNGVLVIVGDGEAGATVLPETGFTQPLVPSRAGDLFEAAPFGEGWLVVQSGERALVLWQLDARGAVIERTVLQEPGAAKRAVIAAGPDGAMIAWFEGSYDLPRAIHSAWVAADGAIVRHHETRQIDTRSNPSQLALVRRGAGFDLWFTLVPSVNIPYTLGLARFDASGVIRDLSLQDRDRAPYFYAAASTGEHSIVAIGGMTIIGHPLELMRHDGTGWIAAVGPVPEVSPSLIGTPGGFLAAWVERSSDRMRILVAPVGLQGERPATGRVIRDIEGYPSPPQLIAGPGIHLLTWVNGSQRHGLILEDDGSPLDEESFVIPFGASEVRGVWNGSAYFLVWEQGGAIVGGAVAPAGHTSGTVPLTTPVTVPEGYASFDSGPAVAFDGSRLVLAYTSNVGLFCYFPACSYTPTQMLQVFQSDGRPTGPPTVLSEVPAAYTNQPRVTPHLAAKDGVWALTFTTGDGVFGTLGSTTAPGGRETVPLLRIGGALAAGIAAADDGFRFAWLQSTTIGFGTLDPGTKRVEKKFEGLDPYVFLGAPLLAVSDDRALVVASSTWPWDARAGVRAIVGVFDTFEGHVRQRPLTRPVF